MRPEELRIFLRDRWIDADPGTDLEPGGCREAGTDLQIPPQIEGRIKLYIEIVKEHYKTSVYKTINIQPFDNLSLLPGLVKRDIEFLWISQI